MFFEAIKHLFDPAIPVVEDIENAVILGSTQSAFYHEAGHVAAAVSCGAKVHQAFVDITVPSHAAGQTRMTTTPRQRVTVCLGGAAAEIWLFQNGRYRLDNGKKPSTEEFIDKIDVHVGQDVLDYVVALSNVQENVSEIDAKIRFIEAAHNLIPQMDWLLVERIVSAMRHQPYLEETDLIKIIKN